MHRCLFLSVLILSSCTLPSSDRPPNVVLILIDDLGWADLSCYGSTYYETPAIDRLASQGVRFTDAYAAAAICSPARAGLITGQYPARLNITDWIPGSDPQNRILLGAKDEHQLPLASTTIAEVFKAEGYATAFFGKWHLGEEGFFPEDQGFDLNKGGHWAGQPASYFYPYKNDRKRWDVPGLEGGEEGEYLTDRLANEAIDFIQQQKEQPFFVMLSHYTVHTPIQAKEEDIEYYQNKPKSRLDTIAFSAEGDARTKLQQDNPTYAAMIKSMDESVASILKTLETLDIEEETIIVFTSDNGGLTTLPARREAPTAGPPLRAGKGWLYEGGIRVPMIMHWPGKIAHGKVSNLPISGIDIFSTLIGLAGLDASKHEVDGDDLSPQILGKAQAIERQVFWHFPHYHGSGSLPSAAIRSGDYKLIHWYEAGTSELYNLKKDLSETRDLSEKNPQIRDSLYKALLNWQKEVGAQLPERNPRFEKTVD